METRTKLYLRTVIGAVAIFFFVLILMDMLFQAIVVAFLLAVALFIFFGYRQYASILKLRTANKKAELSHLNSQVNPHFFFNMINNLYGLIDVDSEKAKTMLLQLSDMMRYSIYEGQKDTVLLADEILHLENYIKLHQMRYHKDIDVTFNHQMDKTNYRIIPLLFIILLENAFKHGVENLRSNAFVHIDMSAIKHKVVFKIENNFDHTQIKAEDGIGLNNLKRRLELVYPNKHELLVSKTEDRYSVELTIKGL